MTDSILSKNGVTIRLTDERWAHVTEEHCELAGMRLEVLEAVADPSHIFSGNQGELLAVREVEEEKNLVVVYRELKEDGFIITAFITSKRRMFHNRRQIWPS